MVRRYFYVRIMARPTKRNKDIIAELLERVGCGATITSICNDEHMPDIRSIQNWCIKDKLLDDDMHRARIRGTLIQADEAVDAQRSVIAGTTGVDPKCVQAVVTAANNMGHQANAKLTRIDNRYKDKAVVENVGPMRVRWQTEIEASKAPGYIAPPAGAVVDVKKPH